LFPPDDPFALPSRARFSQALSIRNQPYKLEFGRARKQALDRLEEAIEERGIHFWDNVRFGEGIEPLMLLQQEAGFPSHFRFVRALARLRQLTAETHLHLGFARSAITEGLESVQLSRFAYHDSGDDSFDLTQLAKSALLVSQAHLLRLDSVESTKYLDLYKAATTRASAKPGAEYYRQRGTNLFQQNEDLMARDCFQKAAERLSETQDYGRDRMQHEVWNIGRRQIQALGTPDWDGAQELFAHMREHLALGEIHISMNLNWMVAVAFSTDSNSAQTEAIELLDKYASASEGYGHQRTIARLLRMTPDLKPKDQKPWVRRALYENAFKNR